MREKLIELICKFIFLRILSENKRIGRKPKVTAEMSINALASFLIENGVVIPVRCPVCRDMRIKPFTLETFCSRTGETVYRDGYCIHGEPKEKGEE